MDSDYIDAHMALRAKAAKQQANSTWFGYGLQASAPANWQEDGSQNDPRTRLMREDPLWSARPMIEEFERQRAARPAWRKAVASVCRLIVGVFSRWE